MKSYSILLILILLIPFNRSYSQDLLIEKTAEHICLISKNKKKSRLAVYPFTDDKDKETTETKKYTTKVITYIINCGEIRVIDPSKLKRVMEEHTKGMLGIVDDETAPETGKLLGADALLFGQVDGKIIQIRMIDATTGEILGAKVEETDIKKEPVVKEEKFDNKKSVNEFRKEQIRKRLRFLFRNKPGVYLFITATDKELENLKDNYPRRYNHIKSKFKNIPENRKKKFNKTRMMILEIRKSDPQFNRRILKNRERIL
jgi:TolB-like protein